MRFDEYQALAHRTEAPVVPYRFVEPDLLRLVHGAMGLCTEAGEFQDQLKRSLYYGKPLDTVNLAEEVGDILWYVALIANTLGVKLEDIAAANIQKLKTRYPHAFNDTQAINRNINAERKVLEGGVHE